MDKCLLIGNGLNRTLEHSIPWGDLLKDVSEQLGTDYYQDIPLPLEFERIINSYLENSQQPTPEVYSSIKRIVINKIKDTKLPENAIHRRLSEVKIDSILTTNYDYLLEYIYNDSYVHCGDTKKKYLFEATSVQKGIKFYHLHGMISSAPSICLGYEHYIGVVEKLRNELHSKQNNEIHKMKIKQILYGESPQLNTWGEQFYTSDIDIIGLDLSNDEIDLWWLITHRAYLFYSNYCGLKDKIKNTITFHDVVDDIKHHNDNEKEMKRYKKELIQKQKHMLLKDNNVKVKTYALSEYGNYLSAYNKIIDDIKG